MTVNAARIRRGDPWPPVIIDDPPPPSVPPRVAQFVAQSVPSSMVAGQPYDITVTMRNAGTQTWTPQALYRLGAQNPAWGLARVDVPGTVAPGQDAAFRFRVTAPATAGAHVFQWRMLQEGVEWFGDLTPAVTVTVRPVLIPPGASLDAAVDACGELPPVVGGDQPLEPPRRKTVSANGVDYVVTEQRSRLVTETVEHAYLQDIAALGVWPGQVIQGRGLLNGDPTPVGPFKRMPGTINIVTDLVGGTAGPQSKVIESPTAATVDGERRSLLQALTPRDAPGLLKANFQRASTFREAGLKLGIAVKGSAFGVDANASLDQTYKKTTVVAAIRQVFYSVTFTPHAGRASGIWSQADVSQEDLAPYMGPGNPPLVIDSVQYGRFICVAVQGAYSSSEITAALKAHWTAAVSGDASVEGRTKEILENSDVSIYTIGVPGRSNFQTLDDPIGELGSVYRSGLSFSLQNPGAPISYTCRLVKNGVPGSVALSADYVAPISALGVGIDDAPFSVFDGPGGGFVDTGIAVNPGDRVTISATGRIWSGVWLAGEHDARGWPGHPADPGAPMPTGTAYSLIGRFGSGDWFETGQLWAGSPGPGTQGRLQLNINDNNPYNGDPNKKFAITVDVERTTAEAAGVYI